MLISGPFPFTDPNTFEVVNFYLKLEDGDSRSPALLTQDEVQEIQQKAASQAGGHPQEQPAALGKTREGDTA
jgi:hypothetical protein